MISVGLRIKRSGPGSSPGRVIVLCSWARNFPLTVPLSTQEYKWVPANCQGNLKECWGLPAMDRASHPRGVAIFLVASCYRNQDKLRLYGPLVSCADFLHVFCPCCRLVIQIYLCPDLLWQAQSKLAPTMSSQCQWVSTPVHLNDLKFILFSVSRHRYIFRHDRQG